MGVDGRERRSQLFFFFPPFFPRCCGGSVEGTRGHVCRCVRTLVMECAAGEGVSAFNKLLMPLKDNHRWSLYNN